MLIPSEVVRRVLKYYPDLPEYSVVLLKNSLETESGHFVTIPDDEFESVAWVFAHIGVVTEFNIDPIVYEVTYKYFDLTAVVLTHNSRVGKRYISDKFSWDHDTIKVINVSTIRLPIVVDSHN